MCRGRPWIHGVPDAQGRAAIEEATPRHAEAVRRLFFDPLSADEVATLGEFLDRILTAVNADLVVEPS